MSRVMLCLFVGGRIICEPRCSRTTPQWCHKWS